VYLLFKLADHEGRFWSDTVNPGNTGSIFPRRGIALSFYRRASPRRFSLLVNGDGEKTYGRTVDGTQIQSADDAVTHDAVLAHYALPGMGVLILGLATYACCWVSKRCRCTHWSFSARMSRSIIPFCSGVCAVMNSSHGP
jgi:hypothetical protein